MKNYVSALALRTPIFATLILCGTVYAATAQSLPSPWMAQDVGGPGLPGSTTHGAGIYTVKAAGADIWDAQDEFHFLYQPVTGNVEIVTRLSSIGKTNPWSRGGVMIRESLSADARHAMIALSASKGYAFQRRAEPGAYTDNTAGGSGAAPGWVKLVRTGDLFEAYRSANGTTWTKIGSDTIPMGNTVYVGVAATSRNASKYVTATFDNLQVTASASTNNPPAVSIMSPVNGRSFTAPAAVTVEAVATDTEDRMASVDFYAGSTLVYRDTTAPYAATWSVSTPGTYALTAVAHDADGGSSTSSPINVTVENATNQPPTISLSMGVSAFTAPGSIALTAAASDPEGALARVDFFNGTTLLGTDTTAPYSFTWSDVAAGAYALRAVAYDSAGTSTTSNVLNVTIQAANQAPVVSLSAGTAPFVAPATVTLAAAASDPEGQLTRVEFFAGTTRLGAVTSAPYTLPWSNVPGGVYTLTAVAYDAAGASSTSAPVTVTVAVPTTAPPTAVAFTASSDHDTNVTSYVLKVFAAGADAATATPIATSDLGKPAPASNGDITVNRAEFFSSMAVGNYLATVTAIGPGGQTASTSLAFAR